MKYLGTCRETLQVSWQHVAVHFLAEWGTTPLSFGRERVLDELPTSWIRNMGPTPWSSRSPDVTTQLLLLLLLGFHQKFHLHITNAAALGRGTKTNLRCNCLSWCNNATMHLGKISILLEHLPWNSWCTHWTLTSKPFSTCTKLLHCCNCSTYKQSKL
jgi:hypothetical protein